MKLTNYLRALLARFYSKNENGAIGHQAMINTSAETTFTTQNFIAPGDGYIATDATSNTGGNTAVFAYVNSKCVHGVINGRNGHQSFVVNASCKKGDNVMIDKAGDISLSIRFYRTMGGAKPLHQLLQGGLLCLRNTCKLYLKLSSEVRKSGQATNQRKVQTLILLMCLLAQVQQRGYRLRTDASTSVFWVKTMRSKLENLQLVRAHSGIRHTRVLASVAQRALQFQCSSEQKSVLKLLNILSLLFPIVGLSNFSIGGARC